MKELLLTLALGEGRHSTALEGVTLDRSDRGFSRAPVCYAPHIYFILGGRSIGYFGGKRVVYPSGHYWISSTPSPSEFASEVGENGEPMLGISIQINAGALAELAHQMGLKESDAETNPFSITNSIPIDGDMSGAIIRLLSCLRSKIDARILGSNIVREMMYRVLSGPHASSLLALLKRNQHLGKIYTSLDWIHHHYANSLNIPDLASDVCMSISAFHHSFKEVTGMSPLQYVKSVRLHKARLFIRYDGLSAGAAAAAVGYESSSQFSRDFKRFFGHNFTEDRIFQDPDSPSPKPVENAHENRIEHYESTWHTAEKVSPQLVVV